MFDKEKFLDYNANDYWYVKDIVDRALETAFKELRGMSEQCDECGYYYPSTKLVGTEFKTQDEKFNTKILCPSCYHWAKKSNFVEGI